MVHTATGWKKPYKQFAEAGWTALACEPEFGGQGLPKLVSTAVMEMEVGQHGLLLCPMLTNGAIESTKLRGTDEQKAPTCPRWSAANGPAP